MRGVLENIGWLLGCVYSTIPAYWFLVHPLADHWRKRKVSLKHVGWVWPLLWVVAGAVTAQWRHRVLYREPLAWVPGVALIATAMYVYSRARRDFSEDQVLGRSELEPEKHEQRLVTTGIRGRIRHPYYLAHLLHLSGWALGTGSLAVWALEIFAIVTGAVMLPLEERELEQRFGQDYRAYKQRVPPLLGDDWFIVGAVLFFFAGFLYIFLVQNKVGAGGFFAELFIKVLFPTVFLSVVYTEVRAWLRSSQRPRAGEVVGAALFLFVASLFIFGFTKEIRYRLRLTHMPDAVSVQVGCKTVTDPGGVREIVDGIRASQWFSPTSHGWGPSIPLTLQLRSGQQEHLYLYHAAPDQSAVLVNGTGEAGLFISRPLSDALIRSGAWQIRRIDNELGTFYVVVPESVCLQETR